MFVATVVYRKAMRESAAVCSLRNCLAGSPRLASRLRILLIDNSPEPQAVPSELAADYLHDGANPGLAARYNAALRLAAEAGCAWLLLLDDDTTVSTWFFDELLREIGALGGRDEVVALVPRLVSGDTLLSPHLPPFRESTFTIGGESRGEISGLVRVFNSGSALRVSAVQAMGGFDERFWLDSLDHATFHALQQGGGRIVLLDVSLAHELSVGGQTTARRRNQLAAETQFYRLHGSPEERRRRWKFLLREAWTAFGAGQVREGVRLLRTAAKAGRV